MLTVKEFNNNRGNRIYTVEAVDVEAKEKPAGQLVVDRQSPLQQTPIAGLTNHESSKAAINDFSTKIRQLVEIAKLSRKNTLVPSQPNLTIAQMLERATPDGNLPKPQNRGLRQRQKRNLRGEMSICRRKHHQVRYR
ncbi:MAG: hypothetical protein LBF67_07390 [Prevotellaceae bacterium]|jgi:hypothetical protein|nr:hypothetical protein [Prevotellaceae bacterium]